MALLPRIFRSRRNTKTKHEDKIDNKHICVFERSNIRVMVFRDHDSKGRSLLFDSSIRYQLDPSINDPGKKFTRSGSFSNIYGGCDMSPKIGAREVPVRQQSDTKMIGEMIFGSVALAYKGTTFKVHSIRNPAQLMVTEVFIPTRFTKDHQCESEGFEMNSEPSTPVRIDGCEKNYTTVAHSIPVNVPVLDKKNKHGDGHWIENEDSGLSASVASSSSWTWSIGQSAGSSTSAHSASSNGCQRRWLRNQTTSLEHRLSKRSSDGSAPMSWSRCKRPSKYAIAIVFSLPDECSHSDGNSRFEQFFFSHISLVGNHVFKLRRSVEKALVSKANFIVTLLEAVEVLRGSIVDLYCTPRLREPVWLSMMSYSTHKLALCEKFLSLFMTAVERFDTKQKNFFLSTAVTAVLTHHLAWVPTVTPAGAAPMRNYLDKHSAKWMDALAKSHPYNPLWAQIGDLYGAIGFPLRLSRTVVTGEQAETVRCLVQILSYFIRCSDVHESIESCCPTSQLLGVRQSETSSDQKSSSVWYVNKAHNAVVDVGSTSVWYVSSHTDDDVFGDVSTPVNTGVITDQSHVMSTSNKEVTCEHTCQEGCVVDVVCSVKDPVHSEQRPVYLYRQVDCELNEDSIELKTKNDSGHFELLRVPLKNDTDSTDSVYLSEMNSKLQLSEADSASADSERMESNVTDHLLELCDSGVFDSHKSTDSNMCCPLMAPVTCSACTCTPDNMHGEKYTHDKTTADVYTQGHVTQISCDLNSRHKSDSHSTTMRSEEDIAERCDICTGHMDSRHRWSSGDTLTRHSSTASSVRSAAASATDRCRRRHTSAISSHSIDSLKLAEVPMPSCELGMKPCSEEQFYSSFGRSLMASYTDHYLSDFVLHGTSDRHLYTKLYSDLAVAVENSVLDEPIAETVGIVADTDRWVVRQLTCQYSSPDRIQTVDVTASSIVCNIIDTLHTLCKQRMSAEFCLMHLEDCLQEIYFKSNILSEYMRLHHKICVKELSDVLGFDLSDMPLLLAVAGTHTSRLALALI